MTVDCWFPHVFCLFLFKKYEDADVVALGFPSNQFGMQEPAKSDEILNCYKYVRPGKGWEPHPKFTIMDKVDVNGDEAKPFYNFLKVTF